MRKVDKRLIIQKIGDQDKNKWVPFLVDFNVDFAFFPF